MFFSAAIPAASALRLSLACDLAQVRPTARVVQQFLAAQGCAPDTVMDCELALVEACNNAIQYAAGPASRLPIQVEARCDPAGIELRVQDHTPGFTWPEHPVLPSPESEHGRGVFLICAVMDQVQYTRRPGENLLVMRCRRG